MKIVKAMSLDPIQKKRIMNIWNNEYPKLLSHETLFDFENFLTKLENTEHYLAEIDNEIVGWIVTFQRNEENWFVILVDSKKQGKGIGTELLSIAKYNCIDLNGWAIDLDDYKKSNGQAYHSPIGFYQKMGFEVTDERLDDEKLSAVKIKWTGKFK